MEMESTLGHQRLGRGERRKVAEDVKGSMRVPVTELSCVLAVLVLLHMYTC